MEKDSSMDHQKIKKLNLTMDPKISIIVVVYNAGKTIETAVNSVFAQTYSQKELILIDGGSTDGTLEILRKINHPDYSLCSEADEGIYDAMNKGIKKASGDWIYFLGADDSFHSDVVLERIFKDTDLNHFDLLYGNVKRSDSNKLYDGRFDFEKLLKKNISHQAIFYHKVIFEQIGYFNIKYKTHADWDFNLRCFEKGLKIRYLDQTIADFNAGGVSSDYDIPFLRESLLFRKIKFLETNTDYLRNLKNYDEYWRFLRNAAIRKVSDFRKEGYNFPVPDVILSIVRWQSQVPVSLLKKGIFSKAFMFLNYLFNSHKIPS